MCNSEVKVQNEATDFVLLEATSHIEQTDE